MLLILIDFFRRDMCKGKWLRTGSSRSHARYFSVLIRRLTTLTALSIFGAAQTSPSTRLGMVVFLE